ncbi:DUF6508 domain-containing protein [Singulisphaera sp. Ch08]|uniref:DUF6508 domain-containing protein n=1 Tax=Singulisphaera sp. Ch08 TaxID=3120278 RepID=A0AAU7CNL4_9BACT
MTEPPIASEQFDAILPFLALFDTKGYCYGGWHTPRGEFGYYSYSEDVSSFIQVLYKQGWVVSFDWPQWQEEAERLVESPTDLARADAATIRRLLTLHVRKDRFCEGHLAEMLKNGHILALLYRLREIRDEVSY